MVMAFAATGASATVLPCGATVTSSVTLTADVGPCPYSADGIDVVASNVTVNLNGHSITGTDATNATVDEPLGIGLMNVSHVTVEGPGTVSGFDAGIAVNGGGNNTITGLTVENNIAHVILTGGVDQTNPEATPCDYGDGIITDNSNNNLITKNTATNNGPFDGIALVDSSNYNQVTNNNSYNNDVSNIIAGGANVGTPGPCGPFGAVTVGQGRPHQDIGIRIEGPGATHNVLANNTSTGNQLEGISIHDYVCPGNPAGVPAGTPNVDNLIVHNVVENNGYADNTDGIAVLSQGPPGTVCIPGDNTITNNTSDHNSHDGIMIGGRGSSGNVIRNNTADFNGNDGIQLTGPAAGLPGTINSLVAHNEAQGNGSFDAQDGNGNCTTNKWTNNSFMTVNPSCIM
jgi:parallel beta-helix repeat protein